MAKITDEQIKDIYLKFKEYYNNNKDDFWEQKPKHIVDKLKDDINIENKYEWNDVSLTDYLNDLIAMIKGEVFKRAINSFSKKYFIENFCKDFNSYICKNVKKSIEEHEKYYKSVSNKNQNKLKDINSSSNIFFNEKNNIKNIILYGVAGVGKTHNTNKLISLIEGGWSDRDIFETIKTNKLSNSIDISDIKERVKFITFHQSFGYEDFIEGFRPNEEGNIELTKGIFREICIDADKDRDNIYYLVIDEINRGNISKIFGELITLIEEDKRDKREVTLPYSKQSFKIPSNLYIIGTMNSTDKSIALIDIALRRRFTFLKIKPNVALVPIESQELFKKLNEHITKTLGEDYQIGHSYFMGGHDLDFILEYKIKPLLEEYFYGDDDGLKEVIKLINNDKLS